MKRTDLEKRMSQVRTSILLKRPRRSASARSCACLYTVHVHAYTTYTHKSFSFIIIYGTLLLLRSITFDSLWDIYLDNMVYYLIMGIQNGLCEPETNRIYTCFEWFTFYYLNIYLFDYFLYNPLWLVFITLLNYFIKSCVQKRKLHS